MTKCVRRDVTIDSHRFDSSPQMLPECISQHMMAPQVTGSRISRQSIRREHELPFQLPMSVGILCRQCVRQPDRCLATFQVLLM